MIDLVLVAFTAATGRPAVAAAPQPRRWGAARRRRRRLGVRRASAAGDDRPRPTCGGGVAGAVGRSSTPCAAPPTSDRRRRGATWAAARGASVRCSAREYECTPWRELKAADRNRTVPRQLWRTPKEAQLGALEQRYVDIGRAYWAAAPPELHDKIAVARVGCTPT